MARSDELVDHDGETCGQCHHTILGAEVACEMIEAGEYEDVMSKWAAEHVEMRAGDFVNIPTHRKHRVEWTTPDEPTIWLAVHYEGQH